MTRKQRSNLIDKTKKKYGISEYQAKKWLREQLHTDKKRPPEKKK